MQSTGLLVTAWPIVLGCDASGEVVEVGNGVSRIKIGDYVFGCTRLGVPGHSTFQEYVCPLVPHLGEITVMKLELGIFSGETMGEPRE